MKKTLLVSASEQSAKALAQLLRQEGYPSVTTVYAAYSARERSEETAYDLIVINAPLIDELPMALECTVKKWDPEAELLIGKIVAMQADEKILTDGKVDLDKLKPIIFDSSMGLYRVVGEKVGKAFHDGLALK